MDDGNRKKRQSAAGNGDDKNALEWTVFAVSLLLVLTILAYLVYRVYTEEPSTPDLVVEYFHDPSEHAPQRYRVVVHNKGGETAEEVQVELALHKGEEELETAALQIAFSPKQSKREGWISFKKSTAEADTVIARVMSYKRP